MKEKYIFYALFQSCRALMFVFDVMFVMEG